MTQATNPAPAGAPSPSPARSARLGAPAGHAEAASAPEAIEADPGSVHELVLRQLDEDQAQDLVSIPLAGKSSIADHMVIASGRSTRQVAAMAQKLAEKIKAAGEPSPRIEGLPAADWVLIDAGDVVVHLFRPEVRGFYNLERMWGFVEAGAQTESGGARRPAPGHA